MMGEVDDLRHVHEKASWMTPVEQEILARSTELHPDRYQQERMRQLMSHDLDVDHLIDMAIKEGLAGFLYRSLMKSGTLENLGRNQRERLQSLYYQTALTNLKLLHDFKGVLHLLNEKRIQVVVLQGIAIMQQIYDDIGLRPMTDIDLWVLQKHYPGLINILSSQGYQRDPLYPHTFRKGSTILDLHTHILWADRIRSRTLLLTKGQDRIYEDTRIIPFEGLEVLCLNRYDQVLYLSLHALKHDVNRLIWLVDIKTLIADWKSADWEALMDRARELGQEKTISYIFFLLLHLFDFHLSLEAQRLLERKKLHVLEKRVLRERTKRDKLPVWASLILFSSETGLRTRFSFILETLFPRPEILRQVFANSSDCKVWRLYWKRVLQLLGMMRASLKGRADAP